MSEETTLDEIWSDDLLDRRADADFLINFLTGSITTRKSAGQIPTFVLNINAEWGGGKTHFLHRFAKQLRLHNHIVVEINAWTSDHTADPLIPVMSAIDTELNHHVAKAPKLVSALKGVRANFVNIVGAGIRGAATVAAKKAFGEAFEDMGNLTLESNPDSETDVMQENKSGKSAGDAAASEMVDRLNTLAKKEITNFLRADTSIKKFKMGLEETVEIATNAGEKDAPFFILIDELDRCRPTFAIEMLERIKHLFEAKNVVFVLATDTEQLQHSIRSVYGSGFNSSRYLHRFFDQTFTLVHPTMRSIVNYRVENSGWDFSRFIVIDNDLKLAIQHMFDATNIGPRDANYCLDTLHNLYTATNESGAKISIYIALILIIARRKGENIENKIGELRSFILENCIGSIIYPIEGSPTFSAGTKVTIKEILINAVAHADKPIAQLHTALEREGRRRNLAEWAITHELEVRENNDTRMWSSGYPALIMKCGYLSRS